MSQKFSVGDFKWVEETFRFNVDFMKRYNDNSDEGYFLQVYVQYLEKLHQLHIELPFLSEKMKIEKVGKLVVNLHDKGEYVNT